MQKKKKINNNKKIIRNKKKNKIRNKKKIQIFNLINQQLINNQVIIVYQINPKHHQNHLFKNKINLN